ncbi:MAG TPA: PAS domain S-box protein, partial [Anaerolinea sp.]|nr:PAS domain S-box protein [Anaerolinea sp.]
MSVKVKTIILTAVTLLVMGAGIFLLSQDFLLGQFSKVEGIIRANDLGQITKSIDRIYTELGGLATDWSHRNEVNQFLLDQTPGFVSANINPTTFSSLEVDLIALADQQGNVRYGQVYERGTGTLRDLSPDFSAVFQPGGVFYRLTSASLPPNVLLKVNGRPYLATARPIHDVRDDQSLVGVVVIARQVDEQLLDYLRVDTGITGISFFLAENAPEDFLNILPTLAPDQTSYLQAVSPDSIRGYVILNGPDGKVAGVLEAQLQRTITREGRIAIRYLLYGMLGIAATALLINMIVSNFLLFRPLEQLTQRVKQASNLQEQIQTLSERPNELQTISEPLQAVLQRAQQTEQESMDRQILYTRLFEQAHEGFAILDPRDLRILDANQEFISMLQWNREQEPEVGFHALVEKWLDPETASRLLVIERDVAQGRARLREQEVNLRGLNKEIEISFSPIQAGQSRYLYALLRDVTERKQLERTLQEQLRETTLLNQVIAVTTSDLEPTTVFETVCRELAINLGLPQSSLAIFDEERTHLTVVAEYSSRQMPSSLGYVIPIDENDVFEGADTLVEPFQVDIQQAGDIVPELREMLETRGVESALLVPMTIRETIIGWLALEDILAHRFDAEEVRLAQHMALAASRAFEVTTLYQDLQDELAKRQIAEESLDRRKRHLEALVNMLMELLSLEGSAGLYAQVLPALGEITQVDRVTVFELFTSADGHPYLRQMAGWEPGENAYAPIPESLRVEGELEEYFNNLQAGQYIAGRVEELPGSLRKLLESQDVKSALILPFYAKEKLAGYIEFDACLSVREFDALEVALLQAAGASISLTRQRTETAEALRDSEGRYRLVVENARDVIFQIDMTGRFTFLNPAWETITGLKVEDTLGLPFWKSAPESMVQELGAGFRILRERVTDRYHQTITMKNVYGKTVWLDAFIRIVTDASGGGQMIAGTLVDITSYKRIEYILRRNEEALRSLYDITSSLSLTFENKLHNLLMMGVQTFELDLGYLGKVKDEQLQAVYAYPETDGQAQAQGQAQMEIGHTFSRETLRANEPLGIENVQASDWANHPAAIEGNIQAYLGTPVMIGKEVYGVLAFQSSRPRGSAFSLADMEFMRLMAQWIGSEFERERYTEQLKAYNEEIASKSNELAEARDEALEASRLKSEFLATMSHEIRTPLNAVIGMAELLMETPLNDEQNDFARIIRESGRSLLTIINDILDFSKIEAGRMALEAVDFELMPLVDGVMDMFAQAVQKKGIGLHSFISADVPLVLVGDPVRLRQILINLVGNGVKFTEIGEVIVRIDLVRMVRDKAELLIKVSDSGIGLSEVAHKRLFSPFTQADGSTTRKYGG